MAMVNADFKKWKETLEQELPHLFNGNPDAVAELRDLLRMAWMAGNGSARKRNTGPWQLEVRRLSFVLEHGARIFIEKGMGRDGYWLMSLTGRNLSGDGVLHRAPRAAIDAAMRLAGVE